MQKINTLLLLALIGIPIMQGFAQDGKLMAVGLGPEWDMNSRKNFAGGLVFGLDCNLPVSGAALAAGLTATASTNFKGFTVIAPAALFRWYFLSKDGDKWNFPAKQHAGFFLQADLGIFLYTEEKETSPMFLGGLRSGYRLPLGSFFIEPYGSLGYPFAFNIGIMGGITFGGKKS